MYCTITTQAMARMKPQLKLELPVKESSRSLRSEAAAGTLCDSVAILEDLK